MSGTLNNLSTSIQAFVASVASSVLDPLDSVRIFAGVVTQLQSATSGDAVSQPAMAANSAFYRQLLLCEIAQNISTAQLTNSEDAAALLATLLPLFDAEIAWAGDSNLPASYLNLTNMRNALATDLQSRGSQLPNLTTFTAPVMMTATQIAQLLYQDGSRADEIVLRNQPSHPAMVVGSIEVLSR